MSNLIDLVRLVEDMRTWQREYFKTRSSVALETSKECERKVDAWIRQFRNPQASLFEKGRE
jgi:hypothetical protein